MHCKYVYTTLDHAIYNDSLIQAGKNTKLSTDNKTDNTTSKKLSTNWRKTVWEDASSFKTNLLHKNVW